MLVGPLPTMQGYRGNFNKPLTLEMCIQLLRRADAVFRVDLQLMQMLQADGIALRPAAMAGRAVIGDIQAALANHDRLARENKEA